MSGISEATGHTTTDFAAVCVIMVDGAKQAGTAFADLMATAIIVISGAEQARTTRNFFLSYNSYPHKIHLYLSTNLNRVATPMYRITLK